MKYWKTTLAILAAVSASLALAEDFKTINGKEYKNATVSRVESDGIVLATKSGISKVYFAELPKEVQRRFGHDPDKIEAAEEKRIDEQKAAERESAEKEKNAEADLKRSVEKFQAAEQRASQMYQSAPKGTLSGQVFVSTGGGENFKLGAVQVGLFARDATDTLLAAIKKYAEADSEATTGAFYFAFFQSPIRSAETDAEGKFVIEVPKQGSFVIAAKAERVVGQTYILEVGIPKIEHYYWLQPVSLEGQEKSVQNLSNNNLTSTTGTSALILTQD